MPADDKLKIGDRVVAPWGGRDVRHGLVIDVWGDPPTQVRVQFDSIEEGEPPSVLLLNPRSLRLEPASV